MSKEYTGGSVSYYKVEVKAPTSGGAPYIAECNDIIEALGMNYAEGNAFKALWRRAAAEKLGLSKEGYKDGKYDAEKVVFFGQRLVKQEELNASTSSGPVTKSVGQTDCQSGAGVLESNPRRDDDTSGVLKKWAEQQGRANQEVHGSISGITDRIRKEQEWDEQRRTFINIANSTVQVPLVEQRVRGSSIDFPADKDRAAQAVGQSSPGVAAKHQGCGHID